MLPLDDAANKAAEAAKIAAKADQDAENAAADVAQKAADAHRANANAGEDPGGTDIPILGDLLP